MKVFIVSRGYPTDQYKMNGIFEMDQAQALHREGVDVVFLSIDLRSIRRVRDFGFSKFNIDGLPVYSLDIPLGNIPKGIFYRIGIWAYKKIFKIALDNEGQPDLIHGFFTDQGYMMTQAFGDTGIPLVFTEPNSHINKASPDEIDPQLREVASYTYDHVDKLITVSPNFQRRVKENFGKDSEVVTVIPDLDIFSYDPEAGTEDDIFRFVSTGRVTEAKGMKDLIQAFIMAFQDDEKTSLDIFGDGNAREGLENLVQARGLDHRIRFHGMTDRKDIAQAYQRADAFVLYSHSETFGLAYLEALASGLPVIASKCGGPEHLIMPENGVLVDLEDISGLAQAMVDMKEVIDKYDQQAISDWAKREYSSEAITDQLVEIYKEAIDA